MDDQRSASQPDSDLVNFVLSVPSPLESWKHHTVLLTHELDETNRELVACRKRIAKLVVMRDDDSTRLSYQQARISELEAELARVQGAQASH